MNVYAEVVVKVDVNVANRYSNEQHLQQLETSEVYGPKLETESQMSFSTRARQFTVFFGCIQMRRKIKVPSSIR